MRFVFNGTSDDLRNLTGKLGFRMEYMETDGEVLLVHIDSSKPALVAQVAGFPGVTALPHHNVELSDHHVASLSRFGIEKGDTLHAALSKIHARHPHAIANPNLPIT